MSFTLSSCVNGGGLNNSKNSNSGSVKVEKDNSTINKKDVYNDSEANDENNSKPLAADHLYGINNSNKGVFVEWDGSVVSSGFDGKRHKTILMDTDNKTTILSFGKEHFGAFLYNLSPYKGDIIGRMNGVHGDVLYILDAESMSASILYEPEDDLAFFDDLYVVNDDIYLLVSEYQKEPNRICKYNIENDSLDVIYEHIGEVNGLIHNNGWLYFVGVSDKTIYRMNLESHSIENVQEISGEYLGILYFVENVMYYSTTTGVYKYSSTTGETKMLLEKVSEAVIIVGNNIFYTDSEEDYKLFYYDNSKNSTTQIADDLVRVIAMIDSWSYCLAVNSDNSLYSFRVNIVDFQREELSLKESE